MRHGRGLRRRTRGTPGGPGRLGDHSEAVVVPDAACADADDLGDLTESSASIINLDTVTGATAERNLKVLSGVGPLCREEASPSLGSILGQSARREARAPYCLGVSWANG